jgi:hypothetical protein
MKIGEEARWAFLAIVFVLGAVSAYRYFTNADADAVPEPAAQSPPAPAGWDALDQCDGEFDSFTDDGTVLSLNLDRSAIVTENFDDRTERRNTKASGYLMGRNMPSRLKARQQTTHCCARLTSAP